MQIIEAKIYSIEFYLIWTDIDIDPYLNQDSDPQSPNVIQWSFNTSIVDSTLKFFTIF